MASRIRQAAVIIIISGVLATVFNSLSSQSIPLRGSWPSMAGSDSIIVPPSAAEGDTPFISLDEAAAKFQSKKTIFLDAREPEDYSSGHIRAAINLPFERLDEYWGKVVDSLPKSGEIVTYCSGDECESSLFLGRELVARGYNKILVFYGGWREWEKARLPIEKLN